METPISSSIEAGLFYVSEHWKQDSICDWMPGNQTRRMSPKCDVPSQSGYEEAEYLCPLLPRTSSEQSSMSIMSESPVPTVVYTRRKKRSGSSSSASAGIAAFCAEGPLNSKRSGDCLSVVSSDALSMAVVELNGTSQIQNENLHVGDPTMPLVCSGEPQILNYEFGNGCSGLDERGSDDLHKTVMQKTIDVDSINDSCSSSKSYVELASASIKGEVDENGECSSSSVIASEVVRQDLSEKDRCPSIHRNQGNVEEVGPSNATVDEEIGTSGGSNCSRLCKNCGHAETAEKMLICDHCEEAFHVRCCNPRIKKLPADEWYCFSCMKKKRIMLKETTARKSSSITSGIGRCRDVSSKGESSPIELMLRDAEPHRSNVRIGKGFQAEVSDWSGPIDNDADTIGEPLELDPSEFTDFHVLNCDKSSKFSSIGNWLQCREYIEGIGGSSGTICGKWRRAPLFEVQTEDWECFCAVQWDPLHADCSVPQELETEQVLKQLKYIEMLRPRLSAKRRRSDQTKNCTSQDHKDDSRNTQSNAA
ncbi:Zinc finger, PHD-type [Corchorus capsularis]|uniref:Zinc finger, PHD-type n=1 Tax=Corchorus capsularis TaxID=210143 RepID=A0A1R3KXE1_COCAP|nr:Zinc finger, PHD-type [Corchorus capsularis]